MGADEMFAYETPRIVRIQDMRLGILYYSLVASIVCYIVGFQILFSNQHFERHDVVGTSRMTIQQPTKGGCNPNDMGCYSNFPSLETLPYCAQYTGDSDFVPKELRQNCIFADQHTLAPDGMLGDVLLVPTRIDYMTEKKDCMPGPENQWTCENEYEVDNNTKSNYIADLEEYTIMLAHSFKRRYVSGNNGEYKGYYNKCESDEEDTEHVAKKVAKGLKETMVIMEGQNECDGEWKKYPIDCINDKCHFLHNNAPAATATDARRGVERNNKKVREMPDRLRQRRESLLGLGGAAEDSEGQPPKVKKLLKDGVFAIADGDVFRISTLLELAGVNLDLTFNKAGESLRESGTVIEIEVTYNNLHPFWSSFGDKEVTYEYKVSKRPMEEMKTEMLAFHQPGFPERRVIENHHGLYFIVRIGGTFGFFSVTYMLIVLTTALGLLGVATLLVDKIAVYVLADRDHYRDAKYMAVGGPEKVEDKLGDASSAKDRD